MWSLQTSFPTLGKNCRSIEVREGITILVKIGCTNFMSHSYQTGQTNLLGFPGIGVFACGLHDHMIMRFTSQSLGYN
jgi:hypothetical protein